MAGGSQLRVWFTRIGSLWPAPSRAAGAALVDAQHALRRWQRRPVFTAVAILTLALAIGATSALYAVVDGVLLKPLPYPAADRLVAITRTYPEWMGQPILDRSWDRISLSYPEYFFLRERSRSIEAIAVRTSSVAATVREPETRELRASAVSASYFGLFGITPVEGRFFDPADDRIDPGTVVISEGLWRSRFGAGSALGQRLTLAQGDRIVVGVVPASFWPDGVSPPDIWEPLGMLPPAARADNDRNLDAVARLRADVSRDAAEQELAGLLRAVFRFKQSTGAHVAPFGERALAPVRKPLAALLAGAMLLLVMACANIAGFLVGDAAAREGEIAVRSALGADRSRLIRQLLVESALLSAVGGLAGLLVAGWGVKGLVALAPPRLPRLADVDIDLRVFAFAALATLAAAVLFATVSALVLTRRLAGPSPALRVRGPAPTGLRLQRVMAVVQLALGVLLLGNAAFFGRTVWQLQHVDAGFDRDNLLTLRVSLPRPKYADGAQARGYIERVIAALEALPGSGKAAVTTGLPLATGQASTTITIPDERGNGQVEAQRRFVTNEYFPVMRIPLLAGRGFTPEDRLDTEPVAVVSREMARRFWHGEAIGRSFQQGGRVHRIVGIAGDVRDLQLASPANPTFYVSLAQTAPWPYLRIVVRPHGDARLLAASARAAVSAVDPAVPVEDVTTLAALAEASIADERYRAVLLIVFATVAALLVGLGLYGTAARGVVERQGELAVRLALGASPQDVRRMVLFEALQLVLAGTALGVPLVVATGRAVRSLLFGVTPADPSLLAIITVVTGALTIGASYLPARRASALDPATALRGN